MISKKLIEEIKSKFVLNLKGYHGIAHWARVRRRGLLLAELTNANPKVVELFAFLHDSCRESEDGDDDMHGIRAAKFAYQLVADDVIDVTDEELELLMIACSQHSDGFLYAPITVQTCWDADRLDLGRVDIIPERAKLCTKEARENFYILIRMKK